MTTFREGDWAYTKAHKAVARIVEVRQIWNHLAYRIWIPASAMVTQVPGDDLLPVSDARPCGLAHVTYASAAARIADSLAHDALLAPLEGNLVPLPHQIHALSRAFNSNRVRYLLADEVGLGKTIEAGMIMRELKLRGLVRKTLVVAPKGLVAQWVSEMKTHFNEEFRLLIPGQFGAYRGFAGDGNLWARFDQVVCPLDSVKPIEGRRGWSKEQVEQYNKERFGDLLAAGWDLVIVDEAHRLGGSTDTVARFRLGQGLAEAAPYLLLLSATPHQGKTDAFHRILTLIDMDAFPDTGSISRERVQPYVVRTEKRRAVDAAGQPLFKPRKTRLEPVTWEDRYTEQRRLYEAVTNYVREGYNQAIKEKRNYMGFLMLLMQRMVTSSTHAIECALERRLAVLQGEEAALAESRLPQDTEWADMDGQEQYETLTAIRQTALANERDHVRLLLDSARSCAGKGPDAKAEALLSWIYRLQQEEVNPDVKILVFTEFVPTQEMLYRFLSDRGFNVVCLNGSMDLEARQRVQWEFAGGARVMVSTDAGGEGLNLQFCHIVFNFDMPWNPMRIEQRIGRVDRIGQTKPVRAVNFVLDGSVEYRVREVLEEKLQTILDEFGADKTSDVLDSAEAEVSFEEVYADAILDPTQIEDRVGRLLSLVKDRAEGAHEGSALIGTTEDLDPEIARTFSEHPLPGWVERMTIAYIQSADGKAERDLYCWNLQWPDGTVMPRVVFHQNQVDKAGATLLTLEDERVRRLTVELPHVVPGQPVPIVRLKGLAAEIRGTWSLWRIALCSTRQPMARVLPLFRNDNGRALLPTARHIWDRLLSDCSPELAGHIDEKLAVECYEQSATLAARQGNDLFRELSKEHSRRLATEREKLEYASSRRRAAIERMGLASVRQYRKAELDRETAARRAELDWQAHIVPELDAITLIRVESQA